MTIFVTSAGAVEKIMLIVVAVVSVRCLASVQDTVNHQ